MPNSKQRRLAKRAAVRAAQLGILPKPTISNSADIVEPRLVTDTPHAESEPNDKSNSKTSPLERKTIISGLIGIGIGLISNNIANDPHTGYFALPFLWTGTFLFAWTKGRKWRLLALLAFAVYYASSAETVGIFRLWKPA